MRVINLDKVLENLLMKYEQFVDLCICLQTEIPLNILNKNPETSEPADNPNMVPIDVLTPYKILTYMENFGSIEEIISAIDKENEKLPEASRVKFPKHYPYKDLRKMFLQTDADQATQVPLSPKWNEVNKADVYEYLVENK